MINQQLTHAQLTELLTLAFIKLSKYEIQKQEIFDEVAKFPNRKMIESTVLMNLATQTNANQTNQSIYELFKAALE